MNNIKALIARRAKYLAVRKARRCYPSGVRQRKDVFYKEFSRQMRAMNQPE